ncbi:hypothetical protein ISS30_00410 [bacterium]|nr:hypothetical protein [bacterium]
MKNCLINHHSLIDIPCSIFNLLAGHIRRTADKTCQNTKLDPSPQPLDPIFRIKNIEYRTRNKEL